MCERAHEHRYVQAYAYAAARARQLYTYACANAFVGAVCGTCIGAGRAGASERAHACASGFMRMRSSVRMRAYTRPYMYACYTHLWAWCEERACMHVYVRKCTWRVVLGDVSCVANQATIAAAGDCAYGIIMAR